jgi:hypothetical protein
MPHERTPMHESMIYQQNPHDPFENSRGGMVSVDATPVEPTPSNPSVPPTPDAPTGGLPDLDD